MKRTTVNLGPFGIYLWGGILLASGLAFAGGAALTANTRGTIFPQQLANGPAVTGYIPVAGYCTDTATGTSAGTANGQCWKELPSTTLPTGTAGQVLALVAPSVAIVATSTATGATGTYVQTSTATATGTGTPSWNAVSWLAGTPGALPKKAIDGYEDSSLIDGVHSLDASKTVRATGSGSPESGAGAELSYTGGAGLLQCYDRDAESFGQMTVQGSITSLIGYSSVALQSYSTMQISGTSVEVAVNGVTTFIAPTAAGTTGQVLTKGASNSSAWTTPNIPGGDLFMYSAGNQVRFFDAPNPSDTTGEWSITATTSPTWFTYGGGIFANVVNRFAGEGGSPAEYSPATWVSPGVVSYKVSLKASSTVTTHIIFAICSDASTVTTWLEDISVSVTSSSYSVTNGTFSFSDGLLIPAGSILCMGFYSQTASGTATSYVGANYTNYTKLNGPWIKSGSNAWSF